MEGRGGKVFEYLKENSNLDLEVPDIAFNVKKSEKTVEAALLKLQQKGLVTARQNEFGRVYWYALPSAPETKSFKFDDIASPKENSVKKNDSMDEEVDLSELTAKEPPPAPVKKKGKKTAEPPATDLFEATIPPPGKTAKISVVSASPSPRQAAPLSPAPAPKVDETAQPKAAAPVKTPPPPPPTSSFEDMADFDAKKSAPASVKPYSVEDTQPTASAGRSDVNARITAALAVAAAAMLIAIVAYFGGMGASSKALTLQAANAKKFVTVEEFAAVKAEAAKAAQLEAKVAALAAQVENLKMQIAQPVEPVKKPLGKVGKGFYRKR